MHVACDSALRWKKGLLVAMAVTTSLLNPCLAIIRGTQVTWKLQPQVDEDRGEGEQLSPCVRRLEQYNICFNGAAVTRPRLGNPCLAAMLPIHT